uniref:Reverse transcriptase domain-containing protein n=1 Tax=Amphimedon queenslandica TaxID=400682 RepID=A0A1X7TK28_AMPQE
MPFGLRNAAQTFQRFIDRVLHGLHFEYSYIDDVLIARRIFTVYTDKKLLTFSLYTMSNRYTPSQIRHLDIISQFTSDIQHIRGSSNPVADALSRIEFNLLESTPIVIDLELLARLQDD